MVLNFQKKKKTLEKAIKTSGVKKVSNRLKENLSTEQLGGLKDKYRSSGLGGEKKGTPLNQNNPVDLTKTNNKPVDLSKPTSPVDQLKNKPLGGGVKIDPIQKQIRSDDAIKILTDKGYKLDEMGNITSSPDATINKKDKLEGTLTDIEFKKQEVEQKKLLEEEKNRAKKIGFSELKFKKDKDWLTTLQERGESDLKDTFDDAIIKGEIDNKNLNKNINMARAGLGMPESKAETEGFNTIVTESKRGLDRLKSLASTRKARLQEDFARQFDLLNTSRKKAFDENMRKLLDEMSISDLEGTLDTKTGLTDLRTKLQDILYSDEEMAVANIQKYQFGINQLNKQIDDLEEYESSAKTIDESTSKMKGYYMNQNGDPFLDDKGNFIDIPDNSTIVYTSDADADGKVKMFSRQEDGTIKMDTLNTGIVSEGETPKVQKIGTDEFGNDIMGTYNKTTEEYDPIKISGGVGPQKTTSPTTKTTFTPDQEGARTNRHNNPTAFTTEIAKQAGLVEGVDYEKGDAFPDNPNMFTANLIGDGIETTKKVIDDIGFYTQSGQPRWTYLDDIFKGEDANALWGAMEEDEKSEIIKEMYGHETDNQYENFGGFTLGEPSEEETTEFTDSDKAMFKEYGNKGKFKDLAQSMGTSISNAKEQYNKWKETINLSVEDKVKLKKMLFAISGKQTSEEERQSFYEDFLELRNNGYTDKGIIDRFAGYYLYDDNEGDTQMQSALDKFKKYTYGVNEELPGNIASQINNGNIEGAMNMIEDARFSKKGDENPVNEVQGYLGTYDRITEGLNKYEEQFGPLKGWSADKINKYITGDSEFQEMLGNLALYVAEYRNKISGTAVTESESKFLENVIPEITDKPENAFGKIKVIKDKITRDYNIARKNAGLPVFNDNEIRNNEERLKKYIGQTPVDISKSSTMGSMGVGIGAGLGTGAGFTGKKDLDETDKEFFKGGNKGLDKVDEDFFNNL